MIETAVSMMIAAIVAAMVMVINYYFEPNKPKKSKHAQCLAHIKEMELQLGMFTIDQWIKEHPPVMVAPKHHPNNPGDVTPTVAPALKEAVIQNRRQSKDGFNRKIVIDEIPPMVAGGEPAVVKYHYEIWDGDRLLARSGSVAGISEPPVVKPVRQFDRRTRTEIINDIRKKSKTVPPMMIDHSIEKEWPGNFDFSRRRHRA